METSLYNATIEQQFTVVEYSKLSIIRPGLSRLLEFEKKIVQVV